jgi:purine-nucleoside phosphorylase
MATPHISAAKEDIAKIVVMPGDPLRAKLFAEEYLDDAVLINEVRGMLAYTGTINGKKVTVMGHGMGLESIAIYSYELYKFYDVDTIIRFGSAGSYDENINILDVVIAEEA